MAYYTNSRSPPPLQHPVPTHPAYIPEPPSTPASPQGYQRYTSSPSQPPQQAYAQHVPGPAPQPYVGHGAGFTPVSPPQHAASLRGGGAGGQIPPVPAGPMAPVDFGAAWGLNDATAQFGMQLGQSAVAAGQDYMQKNVRPP